MSGNAYGTVSTPTGVGTPVPYSYGVALGLVPGHTRSAGLGYNPSVTAANQDIWAGGGLYPFQTSAQTLEILSSSVNDTAAGTGARTVSIIALDGNYNQVTQVVTLNGTSVVAIPGGPYLRVNAVQVMTAGSGFTNAGNITVRVSSAGATQGYILAGATIMQSSVYTAPAGFTLLVDKIIYLINASSAAGAWVNVAVITQTPVGNPASLLSLQRFQITNQDISPFELTTTFPIVVQSQQDFTLRCIGISGTLAVTAAWQGTLVNNSNLT